MADVNANIGISIDSSNALAQLKALQRQIALFHTSVARSSETAALAQQAMQKNLVNSINSLGGFTAELRTVRTTAESFTNALEKNKFSMREYFRYAAASTRTFGRTFTSEFDTVSKTAEDRVRRLQTQYIKMGRDASGAMKAIAVIPDALNMEDRNTQMQIAAQRQQIFNQLVRQGSTNLLNFGKNTQWAGRQLMVGFTLPLATLGTVASKTFMEMEQAALKFRKVYGDLFTSEEETQAALENIQNVAQAYTKYGISVAQTVALASDAAAAGFQGLDLQRQTEQATRLAILGQIDQQQALDTTISLQNAFRMSSEDLADAINFLNAVENQTVTGIEDLTIAIPKAAPVVQQLGGDVKDLAFFLTAMKEGGINASEGANALKSGLASIINPTGKAADMLASMGINIDKIVESNRGDLKATVIEFAEAMNRLDPLARARAIEQLFGKFQFARISTLLQNVTATGTQADRVLGLASASVQELADLSAKELGMTAESAMNKFKGAVEDLRFALIPIGEVFLNIVTPAIDSITKILDAFNNLGDGTKKTIATVAFVLGGIGPIALMTFGLLANGFANIIKGAQFLRNTFLRLSGQSKVLGLSTEYLTAEQLDAAAAAASLNQAHASLTQQFTVEATAVNALRDAYLSAISASNKFATTNPGMMVPRRAPRFAQGGMIKGPGTGTSDSIIARVSNGEAIIPAKSVARFPDVVNGLISSNMPGFSRGGVTEFAHIGGFESVGAASLFERLGTSAKTATTERTGRILEALAMQFGDALKVNVYNKLGIRTGTTASGQSINNLLAKGGVGQEEFLADWDKQGLKRWSTSLRNAGLKLDDVSQDLPILDQHMRQYISSLDKSTKITDAEVKQAYDFARSKMSAESKLISSFNALSQTAGEARINISQAQASAAGLPVAPGGGSKGARQLGQDKIRLGGERFTFYRSAGFAMVEDAKNGIVQGIKKALRIASPSKEMDLIGENAGKSFAAGAKSQIDDAQIAGEQIASSVVDGATQSGRTRGGRRVSMAAGAPGTQPIVVTNIGRGSAVTAPIGEMPAEAQSTRGRGSYRPGVRTGVGPSGETMKYFNLAPRAGMSLIPVTDISRRQSDTAKDLENNLGKVNDETVQTSKRFAGLTNNLTSISFAASALSGALMMATNGSNAALSEFSNKVFMASNALMAFSMLNNLMPTGGIAGRFRGAAAAGRAAAAGTAISTAGTAGGAFATARGAARATRVAGAGSGLPGVLGKIVPLFGRLAVVVSKFLGPIGIATTVLGGIYWLWKKNKESNEKARKATEGLADAMTITTEKAKSLGEFFGITPQLLPSQALKLGLGNPEELTQRQQLMESDFFKQQFVESGDVDAIRRATRRQATQIFSSITTMMRGQGFTEEMIQTTVDALKAAAGRTDLVFEVQSVKFKDIDRVVTASLKRISQLASGGIIGKQLEKELKTTGRFIGNTLAGLAGQLNAGKISAQQFTTIMESVNQQFLSLDENSRRIMVTQMFADLDQDAKNLIGSVKDLNAQYLLTQAALLGINIANYAGINSLDRRELNMAMNDLAANVVRQISSIASIGTAYADAINSATTTTTSTSESGEKGLSALQKAVIARYEKELSALQKKRDALKEVNDELKRQFEFEQRQNELSQQMAEAKVSGNYIQAAILGQEKAFEASEFARETKELELEKRISVIEDRIRQIEAGGRVSKAEAALAGKVFNKKTDLDGKGPKPKPTAPKPTDNKQIPIDKVNYSGYQGIFDPSKVVSTSKVIRATEQLGLAPIPISSIPGFTWGESFTYRNRKFTLKSDAMGNSYYQDEKGNIWKLEGLGKTSKLISQKTPKYAQGGLIKGPGTGTSDSIMAVVDSAKKFNTGGMIRVSNNEYVMRAKAVKDYGVGFMNAVNSSTYPANNTSTVYNSYKIDVSGVHDPEMAANLVMKKLQTISNKSASNSNAVSNNRKVWK